MTREEAIEFGNMWLEMNEDCKDSSTYAFFHMAIKALKQEPCTNAISRQAAINVAVDAADDWDGGCNKTREEYIRKALETIPPVTAEKVGQWIDIQYFKADDTYYRPKCPFCNTEPKEYSNYCPNCGAWMSASPTDGEGSDKK